MQIRFLGGSIFVVYNVRVYYCTIASVADTENSSGVQMWQAATLPYGQLYRISHLRYDLSQFIKKGFEEMSHFIQISKNSSTCDGSFIKMCPDEHW